METLPPLKKLWYGNFEHILLHSQSSHHKYNIRQQSTKKRFNIYQFYIWQEIQYIMTQNVHILPYIQFSTNTPKINRTYQIYYMKNNLVISQDHFKIIHHSEMIFPRFWFIRVSLATPIVALLMAQEMLIHEYVIFISGWTKAGTP